MWVDMTASAWREAFALLQPFLMDNNKRWLLLCTCTFRMNVSRWWFKNNYSVFIFACSSLCLSHNSRLSRLWSWASSSVVLKVCLCCYALWLGCQLTPTDLSQKADCRGIPITLPRPNPLSSLWHLSPFCQLPPLLLSSPFWSWQQRHPQGPPWCETHSWSFFPMFLYLIVALLSYSTSTIFTHLKTKTVFSPLFFLV